MRPGFSKPSTARPEAEDKQPIYPRLLIGGIVLMAIYAVLVPVLGFILGTFLFLAAFMYVGGYRDARRHLGRPARRDDLLRHSVSAHRLRVAAARRSRRSIASPTFSSRSRACGDGMIDILSQLAAGFVHCLTPLNMAMLVIGIVIGLLIGVLPGLTLVMGVALALPFTYKMDVTASIVLLTAMYVSGTYGGAFTAILFRIPGEPIDVPMLWDGYTMGRKGKPAKALGWTLVAALGGGLLSAIVMVALTAAAREIRAAVLLAGIFRDRAVRAAQRGRASAAARSPTPSSA